MSYFIINTAVANIYQKASFTSNMVTQALLGESCPILDRQDEWFLIKQWDGYEGWIYHFYGVESKSKYEPTLILQDLFGSIISSDKKIISRLVFGNQVQAVKKQDGFQIKLPDGRQGFSNNKFSKNTLLPTRKNIVKIAQEFIGVPYVWGGKSAYGLDCSGLVQTVLKAVGIKLPRNSYQQAEYFTKNIIAEDKVEPGDLLFFGQDNKITHVAISLIGREFINARGYVHIESIDSKNPQFNRNLRDLFLYAVSIEELVS